MIDEYAELSAMIHGKPILIKATSIKFGSDSLVEVSNEIKGTNFSVGRFLEDHFPKISDIALEIFTSEQLQYVHESGLNSIIRIDPTITNVVISENDEGLYDCYEEVLESYFEKTYKGLKDALELYHDGCASKHIHRLKNLNWFKEMYLNFKSKPTADDKIILEMLAYPMETRIEMIQTSFARAKVDVIAEYNKAKELIEDYLKED